MRLTDAEKTLVIEDCRRGMTIAQVAARHGVSESTVDRVLRAQRASGKSIALPRGRPSPKKWKPHAGKPSFDIRPVPLSVVEEMCVAHHIYGSVGAYAIYSFAVFEDERPVASFMWASPSFGAAQVTCPEAPSSVLALSRMVAVPRAERRLRHISKPLRYQMLTLIDRTRWPVLLTYSDEGQGHTGNVYKCSGWQPTKRTKRAFYIDGQGRRRSTPGKENDDHLRYGGKTTIQRWEHRVCEPGDTATWMKIHGWRRIEGDASGPKWIRDST